MVVPPLPFPPPPKNIKSNKFTKIENNYSNRQEEGKEKEGSLGVYLAEQCNIVGLFKASSTRCSSWRSTITSLIQPIKPVL